MGAVGRAGLTDLCEHVVRLLWCWHGDEQAGGGRREEEQKGNRS